METVSASFASKRTKILQDSERQLMKLGVGVEKVRDRNVFPAVMIGAAEPRINKGRELYCTPMRRCPAR
jgi:hypothetical protein